MIYDFVKKKKEIITISLFPLVKQQFFFRESKNLLWTLLAYLKKKKSSFILNFGKIIGKNRWEWLGFLKKLIVPPLSLMGIEGCYNGNDYRCKFKKIGETFVELFLVVYASFTIYNFYISFILPDIASHRVCSWCCASSVWPLGCRRKRWWWAAPRSRWRNGRPRSFLDNSARIPGDTGSKPLNKSLPELKIFGFDEIRLNELNSHNKMERRIDRCCQEQ